MKVRWTMLGYLAAAGSLWMTFAWIGCAQPEPTSGLAHVRSAESHPQFSRTEEAAPKIVQANYESLDDLADGPRVSLQVRYAIFKSCPEVNEALAELWDGVSTPTPSSAGPAVRTRIVPTKQITAKIESLAAEMLAKVDAKPLASVPVGETSQWNYDAQWEVTPAVRSSDEIHVALVGEMWAEPSGKPKTCFWRTTTAADLHPGETLVVEGRDLERGIAQVTYLPVLGELPVIGSWFTKTTVTASIQKTLYLVTAEAVPESDETRLPKSARRRDGSPNRGLEAHATY